MEALLREWLDNIAGPQYTSAVMWTVGALILLVVVLFLIRVARGVSSGTFVAGGRNRRARLAVMDAAAIDNQRRLVLVRRDNVEHLILIGGPTDVVVEQNIVPAAALHTPPAPTGGEPARGPSIHPVPQAAPAAARAERNQRAEPAPAPEPAVETSMPRSSAPQAVSPERREPAFQIDERERQAAATPPRPAGEAGTAGSGSVHFLDKARIGPAQQTVAANPLAPVAPEIRAPGPEASVGPAVRPEPTLAAPRAEIQADIDLALRKELKTPLVEETESARPAEPSLEDEMKRLLGELSAPVRN
jgi:hypothetical protein